MKHPKSYRSALIKLLMSLITLVVIAIMWLPTTARAQGPTEVSGTIGDTTWTAANSPYLLTSNVIVGLEATLTIEPGVIVQGRDGRRLEIQGHLEAIGTAANPIIFTSELDNEGNQWQGLYFSTGGTGHLNHTVVRYGGDNVAFTADSNIYIDQVKPSGEVLIENSRIENAGTGTSGAHGMTIQASELHQVRLVNTTFSNNFPDRIRILGGTIPENATLSLQQGLQGYDLASDVIIGNGATLTVEPGVIVKGSDGRRLEVQGNLQALGTTTNPITFTSILDNEGNQWQGIYFNGGIGHLNNTVIRYGGDNIGFTYDANITIADVDSSGEVLIENSLIERAGTSDDPAQAIAIEPTELHLVRLTNNRFENNSINRIELHGGTIDGHATLAPQIGYDGYGLLQSVTIGEEASLTVLPGTTVMGGDNTQLAIQGHLTASGTTSDLITFTSTVDDNGNQWQGLYFNGGTGYINNAVVRYGGDGFAFRYDANITIADVNDTGEVFIENSLIAQAGTSDDPAYAIAIETPALHKVRLLNNRFEDNSTNRIELYGGTIDGQATLAPQIGYDGYGLNRNVIVGDEASLTVLPGTIVMGGDGIRLEVQGHLTAAGTTTTPITFTSTVDNAGNQWSGLYFNGGTGYLNNTLVRYGGDGFDFRYDANITIGDVDDSGQVIIENSHLETAGTNDDPSYPLWTEATEVHLLRLTNNTFQNNPINQIFINKGTIPSNATLTPQIGLDAFRMSSSGVTVGRDATLTVEPDVRIKSSGEIVIVGHLESHGTVTNPVTFTSAEDTEPGQWNGLRFSTGTGYLTHTVIRYGSHNVRLDETTANVSLDNSQIEDSSRSGLVVSNGQLRASCTTFSNNGNSGLYVERNATERVVVGNSNFEDNGVGLTNVSDRPVQAVNNYWGDPSGPTNKDNPNGLGQSVNGAVTYQPWNIAPCDTIPPIIAGEAVISGQITIEDETVSLTNAVAVAYRQAGLGWDYAGVATATLTGNYTITGLAAGTYRVYFFDQSGVHISQYYNNVASFGVATYITVQANQVTPDINANLKRPADPAIEVEGEVSTGVDPTTGEVTIVAPRRSNQITIIRDVVCTNGETPEDVTLVIGSATFPMTALTANRYAVVLTIPDDLPTGVRDYELVVTFTCGGDQQNNGVGDIILIDPSGQITDRSTGEPIQSATVTLYRVPEAQPDTADETRDCRTIDTRGGNDWSNVPAATLATGLVVNPELGLINGSQEISPTVNPLTTGTDGRYAWDVVEGCWYVGVEADGYESLVSPVVGVPPEVTDLDLALRPLGEMPTVYLPLIKR